MPQSTYLPLYAASYPILAKAQKPGGVTVLSAVSGNDVPNKHVYAAGTIQMASFEAGEQSTFAAEEAVVEEHQEPVEEEEGGDEPSRAPRGRKGRHHR